MKRLTERQAFERWMKLYWGGISLKRFSAYTEEYAESAPQVGWEAWQQRARLARRGK